eukprot:1848462-Pleurochrysis_carterae.AAC.1
MPAIYSRAMMRVLQGSQDVDLAHKLDEHGRLTVPHLNWYGVGSVNSWLDHITIATGHALQGLGVEGHCQMLGR